MKTISRSTATAMVAMLVALAAAGGCQTTPKTEAKRESLQEQAQAAISRLQGEDPGLRQVMERGYGHAIFPSVGKGGVIVGGAYGQGVVYEQGQRSGYADLKQATVGAQLGGQTFSELIVFENRDAMERFKSNQLTFAANASAVAIKSGAAASARYDNGVMIFTHPNGGLMFEASVGGQQFTYRAGEGGPTTRDAETAHTETTRTETRTRTSPDSNRDGGGAKMEVEVGK